jgi:hypothetical protein
LRFDRWIRRKENKAKFKLYKAMKPSEQLQVRIAYCECKHSDAVSTLKSLQDGIDVLQQAMQEVHDAGWYFHCLEWGRLGEYVCAARTYVAYGFEFNLPKKT